MRGNGNLAQVAVGVEMAVASRGPFVDGCADLRLRDRWVLTPKTGLDHALGGLEQVKDGKAGIRVRPHACQPRTPIVAPI